MSGADRDAKSIEQTCTYYWNYWRRYHQVPAGANRQSWEHPNFYVCGSRLSADASTVREAYERLVKEFDSVRVNSRKHDWSVFDHGELLESADLWTLEYSGKTPAPGDQERPETVLAIAIVNERR